MSNYVGKKAIKLQDAAAADGNGAEMNVREYAWVFLIIQGGGTVALNVIFECYLEAFDTWVACDAYQVADHSISESTITNPSTTATGYHMPVQGYHKIRARVASFSTGTVTVWAATDS